MSNNNSTTFSGSQVKDERTINILDILKYLFFYWKWYILSIAIFVGYFYYQYSKTPYVYRQATSVMIKTAENTPQTMRMNRLNSFATQTNVSNEILQFQSKELMRQVVDSSLANISYLQHEGLRDIELYTETPIQVLFENGKSEQYASFNIEIVNANQVKLKETVDGRVKNVPLGKSIETSAGRIIMLPTKNFSSTWYGNSIKVIKLPRENVVNQFLGSLSIKQTNDAAAILQLQIDDSSPKRAANVLNTLVRLYNQQAIIIKNRVGVQTDEFIRKRLDVIQKELGSIESNIEHIKSGEDGVDVSSAGDAYTSDSRSYLSQSKDLETQIRLTSYVKKYLSNPNQTNELIPNNTGLVEGNIENQISQYNALLLKRNSLLEDGGTNSPVVKEINKSLVAQKQTILSSVNNIILGLSVRKNDANNEAQKAKSLAREMPAKQREIMSVERLQKIKENLYVFLLNKQEENALNQAMTDDNARMIDPAKGDSGPIYPQKLKSLLLGVGCGLVLPTAILLLVLMLDTAVRTRKEIEDATTVPFLAEIPYSKENDSPSDGIYLKRHGNDSLSESFRILRTNLGFMNAGEPKKVITFTSFSSGAGKTFISTNMAASLVQINKKIVLLDLDLRKGTLSIKLKAKKEKGVTHYLSDSSLTVEDVLIKDIPVQGIDMIPIGVVAPNPVELLLSKRLDLLIEELKKSYDYIIVDNVPLGLIADSAIINRIAELSIFVVRSGKLDRRQLPEIEKIYQEKRMNNLAILLNGIHKSAFSYGYGYGYGGYGYGYGYGGYGSGYGYGNKKKSRWKFWKR